MLLLQVNFIFTAMLIMFAFNYKNTKQKFFEFQFVEPHWISINPCVYTKHQNMHFSLKLSRNKWGKKYCWWYMFKRSVQFADIMLGDIRYVINIIDREYMLTQAYILVHDTPTRGSFIATLLKRMTTYCYTHSLSPSIMWCSLGHYVKPINRHSISLTVT